MKCSTSSIVVQHLCLTQCTVFKCHASQEVGFIPPSQLLASLLSPAQSVESRERKTSALHLNEPLISWTSSQLCKIGVMSLIQTGCVERNVRVKNAVKVELLDYVHLNRAKTDGWRNQSSITWTSSQWVLYLLVLKYFFKILLLGTFMTVGFFPIQFFSYFVYKWWFTYTRDEVNFEGEVDETDSSSYMYRQS